VFLAPTVGCSVLILPDATGLNAMIAAGFLGLGLGAEVDALAYVASRAFGLRYLGRILGFLMIAFTLGLAFGPTLFGSPTINSKITSSRSRSLPALRLWRAG